MKVAAVHPPPSSSMLIFYFHMVCLPQLMNPCCCSVAQLFPAPCDPRDCSTPGLSLPHHLPKFVHVHVHCISDAIQPSHLLTPCSPSALNFSQHQGLFQWVNCSHQITKYWSFSFSISPSNKYSGLISFRINWSDLLAVQGILESLLQYLSLKASPSALYLLYGPVLTTVCDHWKDHSLDCADLCWHSNVSITALNVTLKITLNRYFLRILEAGNLR